MARNVGVVVKPLVSFRVLGLAVPAGSKKAFVNQYTGRPSVVDSSGSRGKAWRSDVRDVAERAMATDPYEGPLFLVVRFLIERPKTHFGSGRNASILKDGAPIAPTKRPDATKLLRGVEDALTGLVWKDDAQISAQLVEKVYAPRSCVEVAVWAYGEVIAEGWKACLVHGGWSGPGLFATAEAA